MELARTLKARHELAGIPIVALSAFAMKGDEAKALEAGCDGYITKPINTRTFPATVRGYIRGDDA
ncbi:MAG: response regulator [Myxococcaceae bacterium]|nr:MAG: response regulator [Myxococcaceae bacterium]